MQLVVGMKSMHGHGANVSCSHILWIAGSVGCWVGPCFPERDRSFRVQRGCPKQSRGVRSNPTDPWMRLRPHTHSTARFPRREILVILEAVRCMQVIFWAASFLLFSNRCLGLMHAFSPAWPRDTRAKNRVSVYCCQCKLRRLSPHAMRK
ncbi:hypothetical protein MAPG_01090 [Magnaporthiopsis poae ATCC 64411]|uniref:Uncharacterized protein n=1 Tax=Magnaporthiopsis poae (strain ATCC 64411 / 73-15) TaxID=644358 RepID=A0A0C4DMS9_MAGP6|nr:hypothetical protein MAPG_01090 [Magnaporthiopsis poae ATCC 64411]